LALRQLLREFGTQDAFSVKIVTSVTRIVRSAEIAVQFTKNSAGNTTLAQIGVSAYYSAGFMDRCRRARIVLTGFVCGLARVWSRFESRPPGGYLSESRRRQRLFSPCRFEISARLP